MKNIFISIGNELISDIRSKLDQKSLNDSGSTRNSLRLEANNDSLKIYGKSHILFLNRGRYPGGKLPYDSAKKQSYLLEWAKRRTSSLREAKSLAFLVGRKLQREGSEIFKDRSKGLMLEDTQKKGIELIKSYTINKFKSDIISKLG